MQLNYTALTTPVTRQMVRRYQADNMSTKSAKNYTQHRTVLIVVALVVLFPLLFQIFRLLTTGDNGGLFFWLVILAVLVITAISIAAVIEAEMRRVVRLSQFAKDNGLQYSRAVPTIGYAGMFFDIGHSRKTTHQLLGSVANTPFELAHYMYTTGSGKNQTTHSIGFLRIQLDRHLPHIVLDAVGNNFKLFGMQTSNLPVAYKKDQTLRLEGNFNEYFNLYAPAEYERDALYVFTPDLMVLFMDLVGMYDAEIIDDQLFVYLPGVSQFETQPIMERIFKIVEVVGAKTIRRTDRYSDSRATVSSAGVVAEPGRRLRKSNVASVIIVIFIFLFFLFQVLSAFRQ